MCVFQLNINVCLKSIWKISKWLSSYHRLRESISPTVCDVLDRNNETFYETPSFLSRNLSNVLPRKWKYGLRASSSSALEPASQLNLPETQYFLSVRKTHGLTGSSGARCERSCNALAESSRERKMHNSQFARRQARYYFSRIRYTGCFAVCLQERITRSSLSFAKLLHKAKQNFCRKFRTRKVNPHCYYY